MDCVALGSSHELGRFFPVGDHFPSRQCQQRWHPDGGTSPASGTAQSCPGQAQPRGIKMGLGEQTLHCHCSQPSCQASIRRPSTYSFSEVDGFYFSSWRSISVFSFPKQSQCMKPSQHWAGILFRRLRNALSWFTVMNYFTTPKIHLNI